MRKNLGFSLIELLTALAIIGIVVAIAYPTYQGYIQTARVTAAKQFMVDVANAEETYHADALTYVAIDTSSDFDAILHLTPSKDAAKYYSFVVDGVTATTFTITATPQAGQTGNTLTLDQAGTKTGW